LIPALFGLFSSAIHCWPLKYYSLKRILIISTRIPWPLIDGVRIRIYNTAKHLASQYEVDLFCISPSAPEEAALVELKKVFRNVFVRRINPIASAFYALKSLFSRLPLQVNYFYRSRIQHEIEALTNDYDVILCNHIRTTHYIRSRRDKVIVDLHDSIAMHYERALQIVGSLDKLLYRFEYPRVLAYEREVIGQFSRSIVVSEVDREYLIGHNANADRLLTINVAVRDDIVISNEPAERQSITFLGKMSYHPNVDAVEWFAEEVFPKLRERFPDLYFYIVGATPSSRVQKLAQHEHVVVTGFVENPFELLRQSVCLVAPMRIGAGLQNKVLEAMSIGKAVVTTSIGAEGIDGKNGEHYILADSPDEFRAQIERFINDPSSAVTIGANAETLIDSKYRWNSIGEKFISLVAHVDSTVS
jgi:glycosyltransferase involved in cell wall biosynthesis